MSRFTLRQILFFVASLSVGLSIWRLPKGNWLDIPVTVLSCYFALSLLHHAVVNTQLLNQQLALSYEQRWGCKIFAVGQFALAMILVVAVLFRYLAANEQAFIPHEDRYFPWIYAELHLLPRDLSALAMLAAAAIGSWQFSSFKTIQPRQQIYAAVAAAAALVGIILVVSDEMIIPFLVYIAVSGVEMAQSPRLLSPEMNVSTAVRIHRFTYVSFAGLLLLIVNLLLISALIRWWKEPRLRWVVIVLLVFGLAGEYCIARWIAIQGIGQLSPPFQEIIELPQTDCLVVVGLMILLAAAAFSWRTLSAPAPFLNSSFILGRHAFFYESWFGSLLLGVLGTIQVASSLIDCLKVWIAFSYSFRDMCVAYLVCYPTQLIWWATSIGGLSMAWLRWRRRKEPVLQTIPCINPELFAVLTLSVLISIVIGAPILAATSFSYLFVRFGQVF